MPAKDCDSSMENDESQPENDSNACKNNDIDGPSAASAETEENGDAESSDDEKTTSNGQSEVNPNDSTSHKSRGVSDVTTSTVKTEKKSSESKKTSSNSKSISESSTSKIPKTSSKEPIKQEYSDSDDEPIAPRIPPSTVVPKMETADSDDEPLAPKKPVATSRVSADDDSDDDKPIRPKIAPPKADSSKKRKAKKESSSGSSSSSSSEEEEDRSLRRRKSAPSRPSASSQIKDWLIERYLVRWWYNEEWPPKQRPAIDVPAGYKEMEHYPFMYINEKSGHVLNKRTPEIMPPCRQKMLKLKESEIRAMVLSAIAKQKKVLAESEPKNKALQKELDSEAEEVKKKDSGK